MPPQYPWGGGGTCKQLTVKKSLLTKIVGLGGVGVTMTTCCTGQLGSMLWQCRSMAKRMWAGKYGGHVKRSLCSALRVSASTYVRGRGIMQWTHPLTVVQLHLPPPITCKFVGTSPQC